MSIEKLNDKSKIYAEGMPFVQILNSVVEHIKDNDAFRIYVFLASKAKTWEVAKRWTVEKCGVGQRKAKQCWSYLERCGLIKYIHVRTENGTFSHHDVQVLNGMDFKPDEPFLKTVNDTSGAETAPVEKLSTEMAHHRCKNPPGGQTTRVDFAPQLNKDLNINKECETKKRKSFCSSDQKKSKNDWRQENTKVHDFADAMNVTAMSKQQMEREAKHIEESNAFKRAEMPEALRRQISGLRRADGKLR